jgi:hypothetical protein
VVRLDELVVVVVWVVGCGFGCVVVCVVVVCEVVRGGVVVCLVVLLGGRQGVGWHGLSWRGRDIGIPVGGVGGNGAMVLVVGTGSTT